MKKEQQIIAMIGLLAATVIVLGAAFVKNYDNDGNSLEEEIIKIEEENTESVIIEDSTEETEVIEEVPSDSWEFVSSDISYFDDALFIGDSRTVGIKEYGTLTNADFFAVQGMSVYNLWKEELEVSDLGEIRLEQLLNTRSYAKIYIMLGLNEIGYDLDNVAKKYQETLDTIHNAQPDAIIYICSNLHVTKKRSLESEVENNVNIDILNEKLSFLADEETSFWLDVNEEFNDAQGNLLPEYTSDNVHLYAKYYKDWSEWFCEKTVQKHN